jgi:hypothetical protein
MPVVLLPLLVAGCLSVGVQSPAGERLSLPDTRTPPEITVVVDYFDERDTRRVRSALRAFISAAPEGSRIWFMALGEDPPGVGDYTSDAQALSENVGILAALSEAQLWNRFDSSAPASIRASASVDRTLTRLFGAFGQRPSQGRVVVLLVSEQVLNCDRRLTDRTFKPARDLGIRVDVIRLRSDLRPGLPPGVDAVDPLVDRVLSRVTRATGGRDVLAFTTDVGHALGRVASDLRKR